MRIRIEYCTSWGYRERAAGLAAEILEAHEEQVSDLTLVPSAGGVFEVDVNGTRVFSKQAIGRHAEPGEVLGLVDAQLR